MERLGAPITLHGPEEKRELMLQCMSPDLCYGAKRPLFRCSVGVRRSPNFGLRKAILSIACPRRSQLCICREIEGALADFGDSTGIVPAVRFFAQRTPYFGSEGNLAREAPENAGLGAPCPDLDET